MIAFDQVRRDEGELAANLLARDTAMNFEQFCHREPIADRGISVVMVAFNDAESLDGEITGVTQSLNQLGRGHEVVVVDDGSTDGTAEIARQLAAANRRVRLIRHDEHRGYGAALSSGFTAAKYPLVLQMDCGNRFDPADVAKLLAEIDRVDIVCGFGTEPARQQKRGVAHAPYRWFLRLVFGVHVKDVDCGLRLFRRAALRRIPIQSNGRFVNAEILAKATFMNMLVGEAGVSNRTRPAPDVPREPFTQTLREAGRVFRRPQFTHSEPAVATTPPATDAA